MIYWLIGQPGCGKTTLAKRLKREFENLGTATILHLDGDALREIFGNNYNKENFTKEYRIEQTKILQKLVRHISDQDITVVVSTVSPYRDVRESFKKSQFGIKEIYVYTNETRGRENFHCKEFEEPLDNFIPICTDNQTPEESFKNLWNLI